MRQEEPAGIPEQFVTARTAAKIMGIRENLIAVVLTRDERFSSLCPRFGIYRLIPRVLLEFPNLF